MQMAALKNRKTENCAQNCYCLLYKQANGKGQHGSLGGSLN